MRAAERRWSELYCLADQAFIDEKLDVMGRNLGGRAYLVAKLGEHGVSRRQAVEILSRVFREMGLALRRGEYVEFPFGCLKADKRLSQRWEMIGDEPMRPYFVEHHVDEEGERLLEGGTPPAWTPGWSRKVDKRSLVYRWDRSLERDRKERMNTLKRVVREGKRKLLAVNKPPRTGK